MRNWESGATCVQRYGAGPAATGAAPAEFAADLGTVEEEADESACWIELLTDGGIVKPEVLADPHAEAGEIVAMVAASIQTARERL